MRQQIIDLLEVLNKNLDGQLVTNSIEGYVDKIIEKATIIEIIKGDELLAFIAYYDNDIKKECAFLSMLAVKPQIHNRGYGEKLLKQAISSLREKRFKFFELEVLEANKKAIKFYTKHDFHTIELRESKYYMKKIF